MKHLETLKLVRLKVQADNVLCGNSSCPNILDLTTLSIIIHCICPGDHTDMSALVSIGQHKSELVGIRQHWSALVSVGQHGAGCRVASWVLKQVAET